MDMNQNQSHAISLSDGRTSGYLELGDPHGQPLMIMHGLPGSRFDGLYVKESEFFKQNIRAILPDRPGIGLSDYQPGRKITDWPTDIIALADALAIDRFSMLGISVGGPFALACALKIPERLNSIGIVSSIAPLDIPGITAAMGPGKYFFLNAVRMPWVVHLQFKILKYGLRKKPAQIFRQVKATFPPPDQTAFDLEHVKQAFLQSMQEMMRRGTRGMVYEAGLLARPWGFSPADIDEPIQYWYGGQDTNAPPHMGKYLSETIPNVHIHYEHEEGHFSILINQFDKILQSIK
jgi:pimeloyl-ACP methyl ester carboxylesterase